MSCITGSDKGETCVAGSEADSFSFCAAKKDFSSEGSGFTSFEPCVVRKVGEELSAADFSTEEIFFSCCEVDVEIAFCVSATEGEVGTEGEIVFSSFAFDNEVFPSFVVGPGGEIISSSCAGDNEVEVVCSCGVGTEGKLVSSCEIDSEIFSSCGVGTEGRVVSSKAVDFEIVVFSFCDVGTKTHLFSSCVIDTGEVSSSCIVDTSDEATLLYANWTSLDP